MLFGLNCCLPTETALLPTTEIELGEASDYSEELILSVSHARDLTVSSIQAAQRKYKTPYDKKATTGINFVQEIGF